MNDNYTKKDAMIASGYSDATARNPVKVEQSDGFKLAMAGIFAQSGNVSMAILNEMDAKINAGQLQKEDMKSLVNYFDVMTRAMERIAPKDISPTSDDVSRIFAGVVGQDVEQLDNKDNEVSSNPEQDNQDLTNVTEQRDLTNIVSDSIVHSDDNTTA